jgi:asparagine synthase (glutamine-hydrolysing)
VGAIAVFLPHHGPAREGPVRSMGRVVPHRGTRVRELIHGRCALGTVDAEHAPDAALGGSAGLAVAVTGSVDNASELARLVDSRLVDAQGRFADGDLVALLAAGFRRFGPDLPVHLRGVFACVITDGERAWAFRDHVGYRPLFHRTDAHGFFAASEAKQVVAGAGIPREPDLAVVERVFYRTITEETSAALAGVQRVPKATVLLADGGQSTLRRYWYPERLLETARYSSSELRDRFDALMVQAVDRAMTGPDAVALSGGIDSPAIAAFAAPLHRERFGTPLQALSVTYPKQPSVDESTYVRLLSERLGLPLHAYEQKVNPLADMERWTALADSSFPGAILGQYAEDYALARSLGFTTILTGEDAEFVTAVHWNLLGHLLSHGRLRPAQRLLAARRVRGESRVSLARLAARSIAPEWLLRARNAGRAQGARSVPAWVDPRRTEDATPTPARERWRASQLFGLTASSLALEAEEVCQAVFGIRSRRPWTDVDLWELFLGLRAEQKSPDLRSKGLVRDLLRGRVPDEILDRSDKTVFDEAVMAQVDYPLLRRLLIDPPHRIDGVDYPQLAHLLEAERLDSLDLLWARELANAHAFLSQWTS